MKIQKIGDNTFIECPHCKGTSECQFAVRRESTETGMEEHPGRITAHFVCTACGSGGELHTEQTVGRPSYKTIEVWPEHSQLQRPVCSVCNGKGFLKVE